MKEQKEFHKIFDKFELMGKDVTLGKMMSSDGLQYKGKNFIFLWDERMVFKLGKEFEMKKYNIDFELLHPHKNRGAMKAWFVISPKYIDKWFEFAEIAYTKMKEELD